MEKSMLMKKKHLCVVFLFVAVAVMSALVLNISSYAANAGKIRNVTLKINGKTVTKKLIL